MKKISTFLVILLFGVLTVIITRPYFFSNKVLFPGNLLVSFYEPYKSYPWVGYPNGPANKPIGFDTLRIFFPLRLLTTEAIKQWSLPLWNPYYFAGNTLLGTYQSAVFHPLTSLFLFLPPVDAWSLIIILQPFLASIFTYLFLRSLGFSKKIAFLGGILFGFSGIAIVLMEESFMALYSGLFLPLILYSITELFKEKKGRTFFLLCCGLTLSIISGWFQMTLYVFSFSFAWIIYLFFKSKNVQTLFLSLVAFPLSFCISAIHLFPSLEAFLYSARGTTDAKFLFDTYLVPLSHLITYLAPDFYGNPGAYNYFGAGFYYEKMLFIGIVGIVFASYGLFVKSTKNSVTFFRYSWLITLSLGISIPTSWLVLYYLHLPLISTILPSRIFFLSSFAAIILACYGVEDYVKKPNRKILILLSILALCVLGVGGLYDTIQKHFHKTEVEFVVSLHNLIIPFIFCAGIFTITILGARYNIVRKYMVVILIGITSMGSVLFAQKYLFFSDRIFTFPTVPVLSQLQHITSNDRFISLGSGQIENNFNIAYKLESPEGYDSFFIQRYGELIAAANNKGRYTANISRADVTFAASHLSQIVDDPYQSKLLGLLGIRYLVEKTKDSIQDVLPLHAPVSRIWSDNIFDIYRYTRVLPRAFLVDSFRVQTTNQGIISDIFNTKTNLSKTVILEKNPQGFVSNSQVLTGAATITSYKPESVIIRILSNKDAILFLSDNYYPGWNAYIDDKKAVVYRADYSFRSVVVPSGTHTVIFRYQPVSVTIGIWVSICGILTLLVIEIIYYTKRKL